MTFFSFGKDKKKEADYPALSSDVQALFASISDHSEEAASITPLADALAAKNRREEEARRVATEEAIKRAVPGDLIKGEGVFLGQYAPVDREGNSLGKVFNAFAAPTDLEYDGERVHTAYDETVKYLSQLREWHGHDGSNYDTDKEIFKALVDGSYTGEWIVPPLALARTLYALRKKGRLEDTFYTDFNTGDHQPSSYWTSTEAPHNRYMVTSVSFNKNCSGDEDYHGKDSERSLSCRPVRLVEVKP